MSCNIMPTRYPYTVTNSYKGGFFMRTYGRNVRRAWDGDDYRAPKRQRLDNGSGDAYTSFDGANSENNVYPYELEDNLERAIRETSVAALSSSPSRKNSTIFSVTESVGEQEASATITPPSSPPSALQITPPNIKARKPTFSTYDKKKQREKEKIKNLKTKHSQNIERQYTHVIHDESEPLTEVINSSTRAVSYAASATSQSADQELRPKATLQKSLTQTVLDFGQSLTPVTCSQCQMSYTPSVTEDVQLHDMYHNRHSQGIELGKAFLKSAMKWSYEVPHIPGSVVVVDRKISLPGRRVVQRVLEVVNKELGSIDIAETELWSQKVLETDDGSTDENAKKVDRYKVFLHVIDGKCVGVCLAERISKAQRVRRATADIDKTPTQKDISDEKASEVNDDGSNSLPTPTSASPNLTALKSPAELEIDSAELPAIVGVSRIWTSRTHRRKGIAVNLVECVMNQFIYGMEIERDDVAFSTPTELGTALAKYWYGEEGGWRVYRET